MSTNDPLKNWQLEDHGQNPDQWKLEDSAQNLDKNMQLEPAETNPYWQPVEYERQPQARRRNWVLPSILIVALLGVLGYVGWIAYNQIAAGAASLPILPAPVAGTPGASPTPAAVAGVISGTATTEASAAATATVEVVARATEPPTPEPTATATPAPPPTPTAATIVSGTVNAVAGVNARSEPATTGALVTLLNQNDKVLVVNEQNGWLRIILPDGKRTAWVSSEFVDRTPISLPIAEAAALYRAAGLEPPAPGATPPGAAAAQTGAQIGTITGTITSTGAITQTGAQTGTQAGAQTGATLEVIVIGEPVTNFRATPSTDGTVIDTVPVSTTVTAIGRNAAADWIAVRLADGRSGWVVANLLTPATGLNTLPVLEPNALAASGALTSTAGLTATTGLTGTAGLTATTGLTTGAGLTSLGRLTSTVPSSPAAATGSAPRLRPNGVIPLAPFTNTLPAIGPALTVSDTTGVNARPNPSTQGQPLLVVPDGAVLSVVGRNAAGDWYQVRLPDGRLAWMSAPLVIASPDAAAAPIVPGTGTGSTGTVTATTPTTGTTGTTGAPAAPKPTGPTLKATVNNPLGANLRSGPDRALNPVKSVQNGESFDAIGRTETKEWVELALPDGTTAWALATTLTLNGDINTLAVTQP